jgi:hypothetical protein
MSVVRLALGPQARVRPHSRSKSETCPQSTLPGEQHREEATKEWPAYKHVTGFSQNSHVWSHLLAGAKKGFLQPPRGRAVTAGGHLELRVFVGILIRHIGQVEASAR